MTTNKPEVVAYHHINKENPEQRGVSLFHDPSCTNTLIQSEPLIRLSDYEALQAEFVIRLDELSARNYELRMGLAEKTSECEKLRKDAERYRYIRKGDQWIVSATQTGVHLEGEVLDELIDSEMEQPQ